MTFEYRDRDGDSLRVMSHTTGGPGPIVSLIVARVDGRSNGMFVPVDRVEEVVAGIRDAARQAAGQQPAAAEACKHTWTTALDGNDQPARDEAGHTWTHCGICGQKRNEPAVGQQPTQQPATDFTEARAAFMQIGQTPSLQGLRVELRIEGYPPLVGNYAGAGMRRIEPGVLSIEPSLLFAYADLDQADEASTP